MIIGLTGQMGAGKSTAAEMLKTLGFPVFDADAEVHRLMREDAAVITAFKLKFPTCVSENGVDRAVLSRLIVAGKTTSPEIEALIYPFLEQSLSDFLRENPVCVLDVPLLFEAGWNQKCDKIIFITASDNVLKQRVFERAGMTAEKYAALTARFMPVDDKVEKSDYVISTDNGKQAVFDTLVKIKDELCAK